MSKNLTDAFEYAIEKDKVSHIDEITARACESDNYDGVEYTFHGDHVPVQPIIDVVAQADGHAIESFFLDGEVDDALVVFVADLPEQTHPAFTER